MAKRFYWIRLKDDFFNKREIKKLRRLAGGDTYTIIYLKMLLLAAKTDGILTWTGLEDTFAKELALDLDERDEDVEMTLAYLIDKGLAETQTQEKYFLPYSLEVVGSEGDSAERVRRMRTKKALQCDALPLHCNTEIESRDREREKKQDTREREETQDPDALTLENVRAYCLEIGSSVDPERFFDYYESVGWKTTAGNPIVDWRAKLRSWKDTERKRPSNFGTILAEDFGQRRTTGNPFLDSLMDDQQAAEVITKE